MTYPLHPHPKQVTNAVFFHGKHHEAHMHNFAPGWQVVKQNLFDGTIEAEHLSLRAYHFD